MAFHRPWEEFTIGKRYATDGEYQPRNKTNTKLSHDSVDDKMFAGSRNARYSRAVNEPAEAVDRPLDAPAAPTPADRHR